MLAIKNFENLAIHSLRCDDIILTVEKEILIKLITFLKQNEK
jgi:hypothetical protein